MDLDVSMRLAQYPYTVQFYGALFKEVYFVLFICYIYYWYIVLVIMLFLGFNLLTFNNRA